MFCSGRQLMRFGQKKGEISVLRQKANSHSPDFAAAKEIIASCKKYAIVLVFF